MIELNKTHFQRESSEKRIVKTINELRGKVIAVKAIKQGMK